MIYHLALVLLLIFALAVFVDIQLIKGRYFPLLSFVAAYYLVFYGIFPAYVVHFVAHTPYPLYVSLETSAYTCFFLGAQILGFLCWYRLRTASIKAPLAEHSEDSSAAMWLAFLFIVLHLLFYAFPRLSEIPSLPQLRRPLWDFGFAVLAWLALGGRLSKTSGAAWIGLTIVKTLLDTAVGFITPTVFNLVVLALAAVCQRRLLVPILAMAAIVTVMSSYGYVKYVSRTLLGDRPTNVFEFVPNWSAGSLLASLNAMARRSAHGLILQRAVDVTPSEIPHSNHDPFGRALMNHIPRAIWPDKPMEQMGNAFGKRYALLNSDDNETSWNVPWAVDFYADDGFFRPLIYALFIGAFMAASSSWMSSRRDRVFWFGVYVATVFPLFYQESNFSLMAGSLVWNAAVPIILYWMMRKILAVYYNAS